MTLKTARTCTFVKTNDKHELSIRTGLKLYLAK